jgi:6-pyruvoyltetrahydropterin/6-carboxytetrahydropterin synthase
VIDFGKVKQVLGSWLDEFWDHAMIVQDGDPLLPWLIDNDQRRYTVPVPPTAENLSRIFLGVAREALGSYGIQVFRVRCYETPNCWADSDG